MPRRPSVSTRGQLDFLDVLDPVTGEVLYPAEAFFYGGKATVQLPAGQSAFSKRVTNPDKQYRTQLDVHAAVGLRLWSQEPRSSARRTRTARS